MPQTKYIFITGGVVSGLGKGITAASIGMLLKASGLTVDAIKLDPYLNVDCGTMSPYEHGEVYVLDDGTEIDLDLGHYERFLDTHLTGISSVTSGKIYSDILEQERKGDYLGKTVQTIPHVTSAIKLALKKDTYTDIRLVEIGGTTGDIEGEVFLESMRQLQREMPKHVFHIHLGYVPFLACSGEYKSKPLQLSLRTLQRYGLQPHMIMLRNESTLDNPLPQGIFEKIALFGGIPDNHVVSMPDMQSIYDIPMVLNNSPLLSILATFVEKKELKPTIPNFFDEWQRLSKTSDVPTIKVALVTKYTQLEDAYLSVIQAVKSAAINQGVFAQCDLVDSDQDSLEEVLKSYDGIIIPGGFGNRGLEGKIKAAHVARVNNIPFLGICLGMQMAVVEFARDMCGLNAFSREQLDELDPAGKDIVVDYMPEQLSQEYLGGTMRLGLFDCTLQEGTKLRNVFGTAEIRERHRHRLEVQNQYVDLLESKGMKISGRHYFGTPTGEYLVEMIELDTDMHPYFVASQSHPEFLSSLSTPHPMFAGLVSAIIQ